MEDENFTNYFIDATFKAIPKSHKKYKLLTLTGIDISTNISYLNT